jgi:death on curing protein
MGRPPEGWRWISLAVVYAIHDRQLAEHGGAGGVRDAGAIDASLARAVHLDSYQNPDAAQLAAAYAYGLSRSHGFVDGNKRTAWVTARLFLADNGYSLRFQPSDAVRLMEGVAGGMIKESELTNWFAERLKPSANR